VFRTIAVLVIVVTSMRAADAARAQKRQSFRQSRAQTGCGMIGHETKLRWPKGLPTNGILNGL
jgi:hypothetical protein